MVAVHSLFSTGYFFLPKVCLYEGYENKSIFEHLSLIFLLFRANGATLTNDF